MGINITGMTPLIQIFSMPRSLAFYRDILGFSIYADSGNGDNSSWVWLRLGNVDLMLNDQYEPGSVPPECPAERIRWHDDTCLYFNCKDVDATHAYLVENSIECKPPAVAPYGAKQIYLHDPDGYKLCFQCAA